MEAESASLKTDSGSTKSGEAANISGYLGNSTKFDEAIAFCYDYSDQNEQDYQAFLKRSKCRQD